MEASTSIVNLGIVPGSKVNRGIASRGRFVSSSAARASWPGPYCPKTGPAPLRGGLVVVAEKSTEALAPTDRTADTLLWRAIDQLIVEPFVIPFAMVMRHELGKRPSKVASTERDHAIEAFLLDRAYEPLCIRIAVGARNGVRIIRTPAVARKHSTAALHLRSRSQISRRSPQSTPSPSSVRYRIV
jgi:hypothetical protein